MSYNLPNPRWELPELLYPRRKPVCNTKLDVTSPIARGIKTAAILDSSLDVKTLINDPLFPNGWEALGSAISREDGISISNSSSSVASVDNIDLANRPVGTSLGVYRYGNFNGEPSYNYFFYSNSFLAHSVYLGGGLNSGNWYINGEIISSAPPDINAEQVGRVYVIALNWDYTNDVYNLFVDSVKLQSTSAKSTPTADIYEFGGRSDSTVRYSNCVVQAFFMWDRVLSDEEHFSLADDPYQFLIPA